MLGLWVLVFGLLLSPEIALAGDSPEKQSNAMYNAGKELMARGEYEDAIRIFTEALAIYEHPLLIKKRAEAREKLDQLEEALTDYRLYLDTLKGRKRRERKQIEERIQALQARLRKPVSVTVVATRVGVLVSIDGQTPRRTPFDLLLKPGPHKAEVKDERYAPTSKQERVFAGRGAIIRLEAVPRTGTLVITTDRASFANTEIAVDNQPIELTPGERKSTTAAGRELVVGPHSLVCTLPGRPSFYVEFSVKQASAITVLCYFESVRPPERRSNVWGWTAVGVAAASAAAGTGLMISWALDVAEEDETNSDADLFNDVDLDTNKHIIGGTLLGWGVAVGVASYFLFDHGDSSQDSGSVSAPVLGLIPVRGGGLIHGAFSF